jgi:hypothetical protein
MDELYKDFVIRDQDTDVRRTLDLLKTWGSPARAPLAVRLRRGLGIIIRSFQAVPQVPCNERSSR